MSKDHRHAMYASVRREQLKKEGKVHLPAHQVMAPKTAYKRVKSNKAYFLNHMED